MFFYIHLKHQCAHVLKLSAVNPYCHIPVRKPISLTSPAIVAWHSFPPPHLCFFGRSLVFVQRDKNPES